jgi:hypothetical protein
MAKNNRGGKVKTVSNKELWITAQTFMTKLSLRTLTTSKMDTSKMVSAGEFISADTMQSQGNSKLFQVILPH